MCYFLFSPKRLSSRCSGEDSLGTVLQEECCSNIKQPESQQPHALTTSFPLATDPQLITLSHRSHSGLGPSAASSMNCGPLGKSVNVKVLGSFLFPSQSRLKHFIEMTTILEGQFSRSACNKPPAGVAGQQVHGCECPATSWVPGDQPSLSWP